jgi:hypothetical protein
MESVLRTVGWSYLSQSDPDCSHDFASEASSRCNRGYQREKSSSPAARAKRVEAGGWSKRHTTMADYQARQ